MKNFFKNKSILITGGTGSFGKNFLEYLIRNFRGFKKIIIFSRDELKQFEMSSKFNEKQYPFIRYFLGDVRDLSRLKLALEDVDYVVHAAALKQVEAAEYNPFEVIKTNIIGAQNIIDASLSSNKVSKVISLSTDKAVSPVNLYGATKLCSDKLFISANNITGKKNKIFSIVRYGNVMGSRGSVMPFFKKFYYDKNSKLPLTHPEMTRFNISINKAIELVEIALKKSEGGEIFVSKLKSFYIRKLIEAITKKKNFYNIVGIRPGEKIHEELINPAESRNTVEFKNYFTILPNLNEKQIKKYFQKNKCKLMGSGISYNSGTNKSFMNIRELKNLVEEK